MKNRILKSALIFSFLMAKSVSVFAGGGVDTSGGGGGVLENGKVYLTDLYEANQHKDAFIDFENNPKNLVVEQKIVGRLSGAGFSPVFMRSLVIKVQELIKMDALLGTFILEGILKTNWIFTNLKLLETNDTKPCFLNLNPVQIAVRTGPAVTISKSLFDRMDTGNQVALFVHEILSALVKSEQSSTCQIRRTVGYLFTKYKFTSNEDRKVMFSGLPSKFSLLQNVNQPLAYNYYFSDQSLRTFKSLNSSKVSFVAVDGYFFFPKYSFTQITSLQKKNNLSSRVVVEEKSFVLDPNGLENFNNCYSKVISMEINALQPKVSYQGLENGQVAPKLIWNLAPVRVLRINRLQTEKDKFVCSKEDYQILKLIDSWRSQLKMVSCSKLGC